MGLLQVESDAMNLIKALHLQDLSVIDTPEGSFGCNGPKTQGTTSPTSISLCARESQVSSPAREHQGLPFGQNWQGTDGNGLEHSKFENKAKRVRFFT
jgi:hypothetical protein